MLSEQTHNHKHVLFLPLLLGIAEANPHKFRLDYGELESRKQFIRDTRTVIKVREGISAGFDHKSSDSSE